MGFLYIRQCKNLYNMERKDTMGLLDKEKERLKNHYNKLSTENKSIKKETENSLKTLTKIEIEVAKTLISFAEIYIKIGCSPDFYEMDGFGDKKVNLNIDDLKSQSRRITFISENISENDSRAYAAVSLIGTKKLLEVSDSLGINDSKVEAEQIDDLKAKLNGFSSDILDKDLIDNNLKIDSEKAEGIFDCEKTLHKAIGDFKDINSDLNSIKSNTDIYSEKLKYLMKIYEEYKEIVREYIDFTRVKNWKDLDKNQDALMAIHTNIAVAQTLHDMISIGVYDSGIKEMKKMIERADEVINVIEVYLKVNIF